MNKIKHIPDIISYFHCKNCMSGQLAVGWTVKGFQVFCEDCNLSVISLDFGGLKVMLAEPKEVKE